MSQAVRAKTAKERASIAARMLLRQKRLHRAFDDCFEMGDGDEVYIELMKKADKNPSLQQAIKAKGYGRWLDEDYRKQNGAEKT